LWTKCLSVSTVGSLRNFQYLIGFE
jgi:hypothetical protein